jgi:folate-binding protein YgfZ
LLEITGTDAIAFAQAQFSNDVSALAVGHWQWNTWLSPQGRVRYFFALLRDDANRLRVLLRGGDAEAMRAALSRFVLRAKVTLTVSSDTQVYGSDDAQALAALGSLPHDDALACRDGIAGLRLPGTVTRCLLLGAPGSAPLVAEASEETINRWYLDDIRSGLPELESALQEQLLPQWLGLDRLNAINVRKGCYPGQEIMARLHFKGGNKRGMYHVELRCDALPPAGTQLAGTDATVESGVLVMAAWSAAGRGEALAVLQDSAAHGHLTCGSANGSQGVPIEIKVVSRFS